MRKPQRLPPPLLDAYEWQEQGLCRRLPADLFFDAESARSAQRALREAQAKRVCSRCPVLAQCRTHALAAEDYGIWGGLTAGEREAWRRGRSPAAVPAS